MVKIALISCTKSKQGYTCPAIEMYTKSPLFRYKLCYCKKIGVDKIFILSAKYHLLEPETIIEDYDLTLNNFNNEEKIKWSKIVLKDLKNKTDLKNDEFILLAGKNYVNYLLDYLPNNFNPVEGLGLGKQLGFFKGICENDNNDNNMISAKQLREKIDIEEKPGYYKWWAQKNEFDYLLKKLNINFEDIEDSLEIKDNLYCIYVGIAVNESVADRLNWHINDKHSLSKVKHKTLSTLRQTISSIISNNQADEAGTNEFIDKLKVEYYLLDYQIKSEKAKSEIKAIEDDLLQKKLYILNIQDNHHPLSKPIKIKLKKLRKDSNAKAIQYLEVNDNINDNYLDDNNLNDDNLNDNILEDNMLFDCTKFRNKDELAKIDKKAGYIKFWAYKKELILMLDKLNAKFEDIEDSLEMKDNLYCIYIGKTTNRPVSKRLDDHINMAHYESNVCKGFLSTFRQSISSIVSLNQADEAGTNEFIDKLKVEYYLSDNKMNSVELKNELNSIIDESLENYVYILNIQGNPNELANPIIKKLKVLRKQGKENALLSFESENN